MFVSILCPIDVVVHRHEDDSIFEQFRLDPVLCQRPLDLTKQLQCCVSWEIFHSSSTSSSSMPSHSRYSRDFMKHSSFRFLACNEWRCSWNLPRQRKESGYTFTFAFYSVTALSCSKDVLIQGIVFHTIVDVPDISSLLIQDQFLRSIEHLFDLVEVRLLGCTQILLVILSKMYCRLRSRWHKDSPGHRVDVNVRHITSLRTTQFLSYIWKRLSQDYQHCSQISQSCGETTLCKWFPTSCPPPVSPYWWSCLHPNATLQNSMLCFH